MNWTGGRLQRHSKGGARWAGRSKLQRQKEHFAKIRQQQRHQQLSGRWCSSSPHGQKKGLHLFQPNFLRNGECVIGGQEAPLEAQGTSAHVRCPGDNHFQLQWSSCGQDSNRKTSWRDGCTDVCRTAAVLEKHDHSSDSNGHLSQHASGPPAYTKGRCSVTAANGLAAKGNSGGNGGGVDNDGSLRNWPTRTLEKKRQQLLQKTDWLGLLVSRGGEGGGGRAGAHRSAHKKERFGKRGGLSRHSSAAPSRGMTAEKAILVRRAKAAEAEDSMSSAFPVMHEAEKIHIEISTNALTPQVPIPEPQQSATGSSDSMLLDVERNDYRASSRQLLVEPCILDDRLNRLFKVADNKTAAAPGLPAVAAAFPLRQELKESTPIYRSFISAHLQQHGEGICDSSNDKEVGAGRRSPLLFSEHAPPCRYVQGMRGMCSNLREARPSRCSNTDMFVEHTQEVAELSCTPTHNVNAERVPASMSHNLQDEYDKIWRRFVFNQEEKDWQHQRRQPAAVAAEWASCSSSPGFRGSEASVRVNVGTFGEQSLTLSETIASIPGSLHGGTANSLHLRKINHGSAWQASSSLINNASSMGSSCTPVSLWMRSPFSHQYTMDSFVTGDGDASIERCTDCSS